MSSESTGRDAATRQARRLATALILAGSGALLGGALAFQHFGNLAPCEMCLWQRWPHVAALAIGLLAWARGNNRVAVAVAAVCVLVAGGIGAFHAGVEYHWWAGATACTSTVSGAITLDSIMAAPIIRCDVAQWTLFHVSLAGFNALFSVGGGVVIAFLLGRRR